MGLMPEATPYVASLVRSRPFVAARDQLKAVQPATCISMRQAIEVDARWQPTKGEVPMQSGKRLPISLFLPARGFCFFNCVRCSSSLVGIHGPPEDTTVVDLINL